MPSSGLLSLTFWKPSKTFWKRRWLRWRAPPTNGLARMMVRYRLLAFASVFLVALAASAIYADARYLLGSIGRQTTSSPCVMAATIASLIFFLLVAIVALRKLLITSPRNPTEQISARR